MYKLKNVARRGIALFGAVGLLLGIGASALPGSVFADSLNPLTERSLALSSSSPGWSAVDGSGNPTYGPPNSGANGQKTGETFTFRVSSNATVKAFTFQYCTKAAGECQAPGNDSGNALNATPDRGSDSATTSDLNVVTATPAEINSTDWPTIQSSATKVPARDNSQGNFAVLVPATSGVNGAADTLNSGWTMTSSNLEDNTVTQTGKKNYITIKNSTGAALQPGDQVKVIFYATDTNYITNPGDSDFFVKINDYSDDAYQNFRDGYPDSGHTGNDLIDGGVTVANIMNESIQIQTKVLETMDFSVGIIDPDTLDTTTLAAQHGSCDPILTRMPGTSGPANSLFLGDHQAEDSLETGAAYDTHSYWRLSSNSSGGATVYYTGVTLYNTEGDKIAPIGDTEQASHTGTEQFGLAIAHDTLSDGNGHDLMPVDTTASTVDSSPDNSGTLDSTSAGGEDWVSLITAHASDSPNYWHNPQLYPLSPEPNYGDGMGTIVNNGTAKFAFNENANTVPVPIASENTDVVDCVTAKMRYIANIAATTPAGIYATKINYVAAPQY